jgi:hypothetical protein
MKQGWLASGCYAAMLHQLGQIEAWSKSGWAGRQEGHLLPQMGDCSGGASGTREAGRP